MVVVSIIISALRGHAGLRVVYRPCRIFLPRGMMVVLSRPNPADDETLVYCTCGQRKRRYFGVWGCVSVGRMDEKRLTRCPRICFFFLRKHLGNRSDQTGLKSRSARDSPAEWDFLQEKNQGYIGAGEKEFCVPIRILDRERALCSNISFH